MTAEWRDVLEFPGYRVSDEGQVWSDRSGRVLKSSFASTTYPLVVLSRNGETFTRHVHSLVALAFLGQCPDGMEVRHLDGNPRNNDVGNLRYGTRSENTLDAVAHGTNANARKTHCKRNHEFTPENTYAAPGKPNIRECRRCRTEASRAARDRRNRKRVMT